jgi:hypothetical protein
MEDSRVWEFEQSLWTGDAQHYRDSIDSNCVMVLPKPPFVMAGGEAVDAVSQSPRWTEVVLSHRQVVRPQEGLIAIAYKAEAHLDQREFYEAFCTSTYRRIAHDVWKVVQHQQTLPPVATA